MINSLNLAFIVAADTENMDNANESTTVATTEEIAGEPHGTTGNLYRLCIF